MSTTKQPIGSRTALTSSSLSTLASGTYCVSSTYDNTATQPLDLVVELTAATTNTPSGNKQVVVFAQESLDNTNWQTGPTSGTTITSEGNLTFLGVLGLPTTSQTETKAFSVASAFGYLPKYMRIVTKNDLGVALTSGSIYTAEVSSTSS